jgi:hypothetical protein
MSLLNRLTEALPLTKYVTDYEGLAELADEAKMTEEEQKGLFAWVDGEDIPSELEWKVYDKLYEIYYQEMPYGTAKGRDGDPTEWIFEELAQNFVTKVEDEN